MGNFISRVFNSFKNITLAAILEAIFVPLAAFGLMYLVGSKIGVAPIQVAMTQFILFVAVFIPIAAIWSVIQDDVIMPALGSFNV